MDAIDRRNFLMMSSAGAASLGLSGSVAQAATSEETPSPVVRMHGDGLDLSPACHRPNTPIDLRSCRQPRL